MFQIVQNCKGFFSIVRGGKPRNYFSLNISADLNAKSRSTKRRNLIIVERSRHLALHRQGSGWILNTQDDSVGGLGSRHVNTESENAALHHEIFLTVGLGQDRNVAGWRVWLVLSESQQHLALNKDVFSFTLPPTKPTIRPFYY